MIARIKAFWRRHIMEDGYPAPNGRFYLGPGVREMEMRDLRALMKTSTPLRNREGQFVEPDYLGKAMEIAAGNPKLLARLSQLRGQG